MALFQFFKYIENNVVIYLPADSENYCVEKQQLLEQGFELHGENHSNAFGFELHGENHNNGFFYSFKMHHFYFTSFLCITKEIAINNRLKVFF